MVIFFNMIVKRYLTTICSLALVFLSYTLLAPTTKAASPSISFYPNSGIIKDVDEGFTVDVLIDSGEYELTKASAVFNFDPRQIQIREAGKNNSLFEQWPEDESSLDNVNGVVMLTGFTQSGSGELYKTSGDPDVFARIEFDVLTRSTNEEIVLEWEFSGTNELFETVFLTDGSPPQNILNTDGFESEGRPQNAVFRIGELTQTAISNSHLIIIVGGLLILTAGVVITSKPELTRKKYGTVVIYDE